MRNSRMSTDTPEVYPKGSPEVYPEAFSEASLEVS